MLRVSAFGKTPRGLGALGRIRQARDWCWAEMRADRFRPARPPPLLLLPQTISLYLSDSRWLVSAECLPNSAKAESQEERVRSNKSSELSIRKLPSTS